VQENRVVRIAGDKAHPMTRGFACVKTVRYPERQHHADRLTTPLVRIGKKGAGQFAPISWDDALAEIAGRLQQLLDRYGGESIMPYSYAGTMGLVERDHPLAFFRAIGASELDWTICAATGSTAWEMAYGPNKLSVAPADVAHAGLIVLWGVNVARSNSHLLPWINQAKRAGAAVWHIDPYRNETSALSDHHLPIEVGSDAALALAIGREILQRGREDREYLSRYACGLEEYRAACEPWTINRAADRCGLTPQSILELIDAIVATKNPFFRVGYGMTRNECGGNGLLAVALLPALLGAWQHRGGGGMLSTSGGFMLRTHRAQGMHLLKPGVRHFNQNELGKALASADPPVRGFVVFNSNPAVVAPDSAAVRRGLSREDLFTVVLEHFQTDTADYADFLLPATTFLEHPDLYTSYGHYHLQWADPVVEPVGESRPNSWVFRELARRLKLPDETLYWSTEQVARELLSSDHPHLAGIDFEGLRVRKSIPLSLPEDFRPYAFGSNHVDGKIHFGSPAPEQREFVENTRADFPLRLISPPGSHLVNSTMGNISSILRLAGGEPNILVHPTDAESLGIRDGETVQLVSPEGSIRRRARVTGETRAGVVIAVGLWWPKLAPDGRGLNELTSQRLTDFGGGSCFGNVVVRLEKLTSING
jgi:anaerobic selenocysteine-containing dehydrogenase